MTLKYVDSSNIRKKEKKSDYLMSTFVFYNFKMTFIMIYHNINNNHLKP